MEKMVRTDREWKWGKDKSSAQNLRWNFVQLISTTKWNIFSASFLSPLFLPSINWITLPDFSSTTPHTNTLISILIIIIVVIIDSWLIASCFLLPLMSTSHYHLYFYFCKTFISFSKFSVEYFRNASNNKCLSSKIWFFHKKCVLLLTVWLLSFQGT